MPKNYLIEMDGVLVLGSQVVPGANAFIQRLEARGAKFLVLTSVTAREHVERFAYRPTHIVDSVADIECSRIVVETPCWGVFGINAPLGRLCACR